MKIHLTRPRIPPHWLEKHLLAHWHRLAAQAQATVKLWTPEPGEAHSQLLARIWSEELAAAAQPAPETSTPFLVSDLDFIPTQTALPRLAHLLSSSKPSAFFVPYFTRDTICGCVKHPFFTGLWFWGMNLHGARVLPRPDWFRTIGRPLDVGCGGLFHLTEAGFPAAAITFFDGNCDSRTWVAYYPGIGAHAFHHRQFHDLSFEVAPGYTMGAHLEEIRRFLVSQGTPEPALT